MDDDDESLNTFLAYTKSPKTAKRTSFQDELKKALSARVSRQQAVEEAEYSDYSDEFESDDSSDESFGKTKTIDSELQKDLQSFPLSDNEEDLHGKPSFLKKSKQAEGSPNKQSDRSTEHIGQGDYGNGSSKSELVHEVRTQQRTEDKERKPIPKPRVSRIRSSPSSEGLDISLSEESVMSTQLRSNVPGEGSHLEDKAEGRYSSDKPTSLSAPSSLMRLNDKVSASKTQSISERCSPEGHQPSSPPSPPSLAADKNNKTVSKEEAEMVKDLQIGEVAGNGNKDSNDSGRKSPSAFEILISDVKEKFVQQETKEATVAKTPENQSFSEKRDDNEKVKHNHGQLDHQKALKAISELGRSHSNRSFSTSQIKKSPKVSTQVSAKSRYLGTLTILDTSVNNDSGTVEAADKLRANVYQDWLEKKKIFLHKMQKMKKAETQLLKEKAIQENTTKKEDALAAFMAWRAEKKKEIKHSQQQQRGEEKKKMGELQEIAHRKDECRKAFEKWKEAKEACVKEKVLKEKHSEKEKKRKEQKAITEKKRENMSAFERWNDRKEHVLKEKQKQKVQEKQKLKTLQAEKEEQDKRAMEQYEQWLERKERQEKIQKKQKKLQLILDDDPPPPWSPPGKTIPAGR